MPGKVNVGHAGALIAILLMYFFAPEFGAISPTLALMPEHYGIAPSQASWISALANPSACLAGLLIGAFAGRKVKYRTCALAALALYTIFGGLPYLWKDIPFLALLATRALFGLGCGCLAPLSQAIITRMFKDETARSAWIGIVNIVFSIGASVGSMITGLFASGGIWQNAYGFYLFAVVPLIAAALFIKDRALVEEEPKQKSIEKRPAEKRSIPKTAFAFIATFTFATVLSQTFFNYAGIAMAESGCDTLLVGTAFTTFTVAGIAVAATNAGLWKIFRLWNFPLAFLLMSLGYALCLIGYSTNNVLFFFAAAVFMGIGCCIAGMVMPMVMSITCTAASLTLAIGLQEVARNLGSFLSAPWLNIIASIFSDTPIVQFSAALVLGLVASAIAFLLAFKNNRRFKKTDALEGLVE